MHESEDSPDTVYYAIGDVHGLADRLAALHAQIAADRARETRPVRLVHLGDYVDRGPDSRSVIVAMMALEASLGPELIALKGNHEEMMLDALTGVPGTVGLWLANGGMEALDSYRAVNPTSLPDCIDAGHLDWLRARPTLHLGARGLVFVHAGIEPRTWPETDTNTWLWTRSARFFDPGRWPERAELEGVRVVHGHTPTQDRGPHVNPRRINVDTGAVYGGPLTAVVLAPDAAPRFLFA
jgi:serine/threonine protein phosphatase 1